MGFKHKSDNKVYLLLVEQREQLTKKIVELSEEEIEGQTQNLTYYETRLNEIEKEIDELVEQAPMEEDWEHLKPLK